ncbi:hypothetical protein [Nonomuraea rosea]|uniref:hypothetical protein n=1 Tax=Nonomuraea rosea TaxID=638574 RepID=UPI0031EA413D
MSKRCAGGDRGRGRLVAGGRRPERERFSAALYAAERLRLRVIPQVIAHLRVAPDGDLRAELRAFVSPGRHDPVG